MTHIKKLAEKYKLMAAAMLAEEENSEAEKRTAASKYQQAKEDANASALATHAAMQMHAALQMQNNFDAAVQQHQDYVNQLQMDAANAAAMPPMMF